MIDLSTLGYPDERPLAVSPGATVLTGGFRYRFGDPGSAVPIPAPPSGFYPAGSGPAAINDAGDQARFLTATSGQNLRYLFRLHSDGTWQKLSSAGTGHMSRWGIGSITAEGTVTATVLSAGVIAYGPAGLAQSIAPLVSPAYQGGDVTVGGQRNEAGTILAEMLIGRSARVVRLVPDVPCTGDCIEVVELRMSATGPEYCDEGDVRAKAKLTVVDQSDDPLRNVKITGHFLDDYWLDSREVGRTDNRGRVTLKHHGPACVGAITFLFTKATKTGYSLDRTTGTLANYVIPS
jgi:hypothetical protein